MDAKIEPNNKNDSSNMFTYEAPQIDDSRFSLDEPRVLKEGKSWLENNYVWLVEDYNELEKHYNNIENSDLTIADIYNLKKRIQQTSQSLANWQPTEIKIPVSARNQSTNKFDVSTIKNKMAPTKGEIKVKIDAFEVFGKLQKHGFEFNQDNETKNYNVSFDSNTPNPSQQNYKDQVQSPNTQSINLDISELEAFEMQTRNIKSPKSVEAVQVLQKKIDRFIIPNHYQAGVLSDKVCYLVGGLVNDEIVFHEVSSEDFDKVNDDKAKLKLPEFIEGDYSNAALASRNIKSKLNIVGVVKNENISPDNDAWNFGL
jgi:hypothetical protein